MLKLLLLAALLALLGRMLGDLWRAGVAARLRPPEGASTTRPPTELQRCVRCGAYAPAVAGERSRGPFLCRSCRVAAE
jgi:hypothetical protein